MSREEAKEWKRTQNERKEWLKTRTRKGQDMLEIILNLVGHLRILAFHWCGISRLREFLTKWDIYI